MSEVVSACLALAKAIYERVETAKANREQLRIVREDVRVGVGIVQSEFRVTRGVDGADVC